MTSEPSDVKSRDAMRAALQRELARPEAQCVPPEIPDHELIQRIGSGAYGDVWLARNALGTLRAVKIVYRARFEEDRPYEREFKGILKYEPISRTHEGLVQVLHVGSNEQARCFYYVMELADNAEAPDYAARTLRSELARRHRLSPTEAAQLVLRLASALAHLHGHGLVHRDIKPGNVIFVGGQPKLADIGLIASVGDTRSFVGTEGFIPPEGPGSVQADIYALGKVLYELATGRDRLEFPQLPADVARLPEGEALLELNEVMTRACAPEPEQRYASATELQADLTSFLAGRSLRRARNIERHLRQLKRLAAASCAFLVLAAAALWFVKREERQALETARVQSTLRERAEDAEHQSRRQLYTALFEQARATVRSGELGHRVNALDALRRAGAISNSVELRREVVAALALPDLRREREWPTGPEVTGVHADPKFGRIAFLRGRAPVEIRSAADNQLITTLPPTTNLMAYLALWSPDGRFLAVKRDYDGAGHAADLEVWEPSTARLALLLRNTRWNAFAFHPHKEQFLSAGSGGMISAWDLRGGTKLTHKAFEATPYHLVYSPDGNRVAAAYPRGNTWAASIHNAEDGTELFSQAFAKRLGWLTWDPGGRWIAVTDWTGLVHLLDARTGEMRTLGRHKAEAGISVFHPDGRYLITGGWERELICWDLQRMQRAFDIRLNSFHAQFSADGGQCAVAAPWAFQLWTFEGPSGREFAEDLGSRLRYAAFSSDGRWLAASGDERLAVWDVTTTGPAALTGDGAEMRPFFANDAPDVFGGGNNKAFCWHITPGKDLRTAPELRRVPLQIPPGLISLCMASNAVLMTSRQGTQIVTSEGPSEIRPTTGGVSNVSPDGQWLAIFRPYGNALYVYRLPDMQRVAKLMHPASIGRVNFSPSADEVAIASRGQVEFWSTATWQRKRVLSNFSSMLYAPGARTLWLSKEYFGNAGLYDARSLEPLLLLPHGMLPLAVSPDGRRLAVSVSARRIQLWDLTELRAQLRDLGLDWKDPTG